MTTNSNNNNSVPSTPKTKFHHSMTKYQYDSPQIKKAVQSPLSSSKQRAPSTFPYYPALSNCHVTRETYCDKCWCVHPQNLDKRSPEAIKSNREWYFHIMHQPHNYPCINRNCQREFVERSHLQIHLPICNSSLLLLKERKIREKYGNGLINFPKKEKNPKKGSITESMIWITNYPKNNKYINKLLINENINDKYGLTYGDPNNNTPYPINQCFFNLKCNKQQLLDVDNDSESSTSSSTDYDGDDTEYDEEETVSDDDNDDDDNDDDDNKDNNNNSDDVNGNVYRNIPKISISINGELLTPTNSSFDDDDIDHSSNDNESNNESNNNNNNNNYTIAPMVHLCNPSLIRKIKEIDNKILTNHLPDINKSFNKYSGIKRKANINQSITMAMPPLKKQKISVNIISSTSTSCSTSSSISSSIPINATNVTINNMHAIITHNNNNNNNNYDIILCDSSRSSVLTNDASDYVLESSQSILHSNFINNNNFIPIQNIKTTNITTKKKSKLFKNNLRISTKHNHDNIHDNSDDDVMITGDNLNIKSKPKSTKKKKKKTQNIINLIDDEDDEDDNDNNIQSEWDNKSFTDKLQLIFHPYHIHDVTQKLYPKTTSKKKKKKKKKKTKKDILHNVNLKKDVASYTLSKCTINYTISEMELKWKKLQIDLKQLRSNKKKNKKRLSPSKKLLTSEVSYDFLFNSEMLPAENKIHTNYVIESNKLQLFTKSLYLNDDNLKYFNMYNLKERNQMKNIFIQNEFGFSLNNLIFLYSFIRIGMGLIPNILDKCILNLDQVLDIHDTYYAFLDNHFKTNSVYRDAGLRSMDPDNHQNIQYREFIFRNSHDHRDWEKCTLDMSLKLGAVSCPLLFEMLNNQCLGIQLLRKLYGIIYPSSELRIVNIGFFQSPSGNPGQNWHTDYENVKIDNKYTSLSPLITVLISITQQEYDKYCGTSGSTIFCLGSQISPIRIQEICAKYPGNETKKWLYRVVQPILNRGDMVCFQGNLMHFGGEYKFNNDNHRVVLYAVLHLLNKNSLKNDFLESDMNISENLKRLQSLFGGCRYRVEKIINNNNNNKNQFEVKKHRWRDRSQYE